MGGLSDSDSRINFLDTVHGVAVVLFLDNLGIDLKTNKLVDVYRDNLGSVDAERSEELFDFPHALVNEDVVVPQLAVAFDALNVILNLAALCPT